MSTYGITFYGTDKYGPSQTQARIAEFDVQPFVAEPTDFDQIHLTWKSPKGSWDELRVLRNWNGFPVDAIDGEILLDTTGAASSLVDGSVRPGAWHYYGLFIRSGTTWYRAGSATTLMLADHGLAQRMFDDLPLYHRLLQGAVDDLPPVENETLKSFLAVLAGGLEYVKTYYDSMRVLNDPMKNHLGQLVNLAKQFGIEYLPVTPSHLFRGRVLNAGTLAREKGTTEHLRSVIGLSVGWDVEITPGPNLMLNEDSASFVHPTFPAWDPATNYATGETVQYSSYLYRAKTGGALGDAQKPSGTANSNTWWTYLAGTQDDTYVSADGTVAGWAARSFTAGVTPPALSASVGLGMQSVTDTTVNSSNALLISNKTAGSADLGGTSTGLADADQINAIKRGVPIPAAERAWDPLATYPVGSLVLYKGLPYRALLKSVGVAPTGDLTNNASWEALNFDDRPKITGSVYVKGATSVAQDRNAYAVMDVFDETGVLIATVDSSNAGAFAPVFDSMSNRTGNLQNRTTDYGGKTWTCPSGFGWNVDAVSGWAYPNSTGVATIPGTADGRVSVTFATDAAAGKTQEIAIRYTANNYVKVTRTGIYSVVGGANSLLATHTTAFKDGDRATVSFVGQNITVFRNGVQVSTATATVNQTTGTHGMIVE